MVTQSAGVKSMQWLLEVLVLSPHNGYSKCFYQVHAMVIRSACVKSMQWLLEVLVLSLYFPTQMSYFCSTTEIRCDEDHQSAFHCGRWVYKWLDCDNNFPCDDSDTIELCCKFILKVDF